MNYYFDNTYQTIAAILILLAMLSISMGLLTAISGISITYTNESISYNSNAIAILGRGILAAMIFIFIMALVIDIGKLYSK